MRKMSKSEWEYINNKMSRIERKIDSVIEFFGIRQMSYIEPGQVWFRNSTDEITAGVKGFESPNMNMTITAEEYAKHMGG